MADRLSDHDLTVAMSQLSEWEGSTTQLRRVAALANFRTAIRVVDEVAQVAEEMNHHPDIDIRWRTLIFTLATHSVGGVTDLDLSLAGRIDAIVDRSR